MRGERTGGDAAMNSLQGYYFPLSGDIYDTLNQAWQKLQLIIISKCIASNPTASSYSECI